MIYDVSLPIRDGMLSWPSDPPVKISQFKTIEEKGSNVVKLETGNHFGTHVDAPSHSIKSGNSLDDWSPEIFGPASVVDLTGIDGTEITVQHLEAAMPRDFERVLLKTRNTSERLLQRPYTEDYVALSGEGAEWLAAAGAKAVGTDYLSIQRRGSDGRAHTELLKKGIPIIEGLWLVDVPAGDYEMIGLPLRIERGDGAPMRVLLRSA